MGHKMKHLVQTDVRIECKREITGYTPFEEIDWIFVQHLVKAVWF